MPEQTIPMRKRGKGNLQEIIVCTETQEFLGTKKHGIKIKNTRKMRECDKITQKYIYQIKNVVMIKVKFQIRKRIILIKWFFRQLVNH